MPKYPAAKVQLTGEDGNAFFMIGRTSAALRKAGASVEEITEFQNEATSGNYYHVISTITEWVNVK